MVERLHVSLMHMRRCVSFMEKTFLKPSAVLFTSVSMGHACSVVDIVVFSASDLKRRTPSSHNLFDLNLYVSVHKFFSYVGTGLPGLTQN